jgi:Tfp pilus assembly protein PilF
VILSCSSNPNNSQATHLGETNTPQVTLSYVNAYLTIGNIAKADERFQTIQTPELVPGAMLALAQLRALKGDSLGAQQAFMLALDSPSLTALPVSSNLLDYFCQQKMWLALSNYGDNLLKSSDDAATNNKTLSLIGQCFFKKNEWNKAKLWLTKLDIALPVDPLDYLALARLGIEDKQYTEAEQFIFRFEETKNNINAHTLWTALEVYQKLQQPKQVKQIGQNLITMFPSSDYSLVYQEMLKANSHELNRIVKKEVPQQVKPDIKGMTHIMKKGETLYQLTKRYDVLIADLLKWNPDLVANNIPLGAKIRLFAD